MITAGYDIGGAHLKAAFAAQGRLIAARQIPCPLWQGLDRLRAAFDQAAASCPPADRHAFTMTGELCDLFASREEGVRALLGVVAERFGDRALIWAGSRGLIPSAGAQASWTLIASSNFLASAAAVGRARREALLIDMGSTTVDLIAIKDGSACGEGFSDGQRLASGALVYTGLTRTPVMAIAGRAPFQGVWQGLAREYFATAADIRRVIGDLPEEVDQHETADRRSGSRADSIARLARMFGRDAAEGSEQDWRLAALFLAERQARVILDGAAQVLAAHALEPGAPVIAAGIGADVVARTADRLARPLVPFADLLPCDPGARLWAGRCAPAAALSLLAAEWPGAGMDRADVSG